MQIMAVFRVLVDYFHLELTREIDQDIGSGVYCTSIHFGVNT